MSIDAIENNTAVIMPDGHKGKVRVTRRERKLIADGKLRLVDVLGTDGIRYPTLLDRLEIIEHLLPECCPECGQVLQENT